MDIESHNDEESIAKRETSMWLGCILDEDSRMEDEESYFYTMPQFIDWLRNQSSKKRKRINGKLDKRPCNNIAVFIYNLSFEWSFLLPVLLESGFKFKSHIDKNDEYVFNSVSTKSVSSVWQCQIKFEKDSGMILLRDLAKIYGGGLGNVAKAFKLPTQKGEIDYRKNRLHDYVITPEEKEYCFKDTRIIVDILLKELESNDKDFFNSSSMASLTMRKLIKAGYPRSTKPYAKFREQYPVLKQEEGDFVRNSFSGGITYATDKWQFKEVNQPILHIDGH